MSKDNETVAGRRGFLKGATLTGAAAALAPVVVATAQAQTTPTRPSRKGAPPPNPDDMLPPADANDPVVLTSSGGDFMVDVLKTLDLEYMATMCASTFRGLHESVINYGDNTKPEIITCPHEEIAVAVAHGYSKIAGKPIAAICHGTVGLQHAAMGLYNAWCDRAPIYMLIGNIAAANKRLYDFEWQHSALDAAATVRDFVKWDDQPVNLQHFAESAMRAYKISMTPPMGPVLLSLDQFLQESPIPDRASLQIPALTRVVPPAGDYGALDELARMLVAAENPVLICGRVARTSAGMGRVVELAEALQCAVIDRGDRLNFPTRHPLRGGGALGTADLVVALEVDDVFGSLHILRDRIERATAPILPPGAKVATLGCADLYLKSNYQDFQRYTAVDLAIAGDAEESLPMLTDLVKKRLTPSRQSALQARGKKLAEAHQQALEQARTQATIGWDASPITTARLSAELYSQIADLDWSLVGSGVDWPHRLWNFDKPYQWIGDSGGSGIGYLAPASAGAALANKPHGRLSVCIQPDGDLMFVPSTLWMAAHHRIPILYVMHNNRAYHQEYMYLQAMANRRQRGITKANIGTTFTDPYIDFATVARGFGVHGEGPISDPRELAPALSRAIAVVRRGEPALVDVITDPR